MENSLRLGRTLPPAAAPIHLRDIYNGLHSLLLFQQQTGRFSVEIKQHFQVKHCYLLSSGKAALTIILKALKNRYPERTDVIIPAYTCYSVPSVILKAGLRIRLCDLDKNTLDFDYSKLSKIISNYYETKNKQVPPPPLAIIPTHLFGGSADVQRLQSILEGYDIPVIEDAAQAMGNSSKGKKLGTIGDCGFFSLGRGKALSAIEGGIIITNRDDIAHEIRNQLKKLRGYNGYDLLKILFGALFLRIFLHPSFFWLPKAIPFLQLGKTHFVEDFPIKIMSNFQAGMTKGWQKKLLLCQQARKKLVKHWSRAITGKGKISYHPQDEEPQSLIRYPLKIENSTERLLLLKQSERNGWGIMPSYPNSINNIKEIRNLFRCEKYPVANETSEKLLTLPTHSYVTDKDLLQITAIGNIISR